MIVWLLGLVFNTKEITLAVTFMASQWLENPERWQCELVAFELGTQCILLMASLFTFHYLFMEHPLSRKKGVFAWDLKVFCVSYNTVFTASVPKLKLKLNKEW